MTAAAMTERTSFLRSLIGLPWIANAKGPAAFDCWHLAVHVERVLFGRALPEVKVPDDPTWAWLMERIETHPERAHWSPLPDRPMGLVSADDGAIVLMARSDRPAHCGVWLVPERRVIHAMPPARARAARINCGVMFDDLSTLKTSGWRRLRFYQPNAAQAAAA